MARREHHQPYREHWGAIRATGNPSALTVSVSAPACMVLRAMASIPRVQS